MSTLEAHSVAVRSLRLSTVASALCAEFRRISPRGPENDNEAFCSTIGAPKSKRVAFAAKLNVMYRAGVGSVDPVRSPNCLPSLKDRGIEDLKQ
jgi:hypothetical protein